MRFDGLWLEAPAEVMIERVERRRGDASDATAEVVRRQLEWDLGDVGWTRVSAKPARAGRGSEARFGCCCKRPLMLREQL